MDSNKIKKLLEATAEYYEKSLSIVVFDIWFNSMKRFKFEDVSKAFVKHINTPNSGRFMPKVADIVNILEGTSKDSGYLAWTKVKKAIQSIGAYQSVKFDDPIIHLVVSGLGGWIELCSKQEREMPFVANEFRQRYEGYAAKGELPEWPKLLAGIHECENRQKKLVDYTAPDPVLIGDHKKALENKKI